MSLVLYRKGKSVVGVEKQATILSQRLEGTNNKIELAEYAEIFQA